MKLYEIAAINPGYTFRGAITTDSKGSVRLLQPKNIVQGEPITDIEDLITIAPPPNYNSYLRKNDIVLIARGAKGSVFRATLFMHDAPNIIVPASLHSIRVTDERCIPEFLMWYLNSMEGQAQIADRVSGSYIAALAGKKLGTIPIPLPPREMQQHCIDLANNLRRQHEITQKQHEIKQQILNTVFHQLSTTNL